MTAAYRGTADDEGETEADAAVSLYDKLGFERVDRLRPPPSPQCRPAGVLMSPTRWRALGR
jgi:ribosomal protein S18 acetylase RimI-like enzyme